jgi:hypothetical protein
MASPDRTLHFSDYFVISCGTASVNVERLKVLLIYWQTIGEYFLHRGCKDLDGPFEQTAQRETEEDGDTSPPCPCGY